MEQIIKYALSNDERMLGLCMFTLVFTGMVLFGLKEIVEAWRKR